jgi:hypothetical protein
MNNFPLRLTFPLFLRFCWLVGLLVLCGTSNAADSANAILPAGVRAVWDLDKAARESTSSRERICLNGLWQWQPAKPSDQGVPTGAWGFFKVPGCWPGITDYMQKDCQTVFAHPAWKDLNLGQLSAAWYQRQIEVPASWKGKRITLSLAYLNSFASLFVDGKSAGDLRFPAGEIDLTALCLPGTKHDLSLLVVALPLKGVMLSYGDTFGAKQVQGRVERRGLCGDVWLTGTPAGPRLGEVRIVTSVRRREIAFDAALEMLEPEARYSVVAKVIPKQGDPKQFQSAPFKVSDLTSGRFNFRVAWTPDALWDTHTPENMCEARLSLVDPAGRVLDEASPERFGFREFWIDGRDFYLNGSRIFLCAVPLDNAQIGAAWATYEGTRESLQRLKSFGVNFVYTHNYGCEPGTHLSFDEVLRAADDEGMLVSFSQPHFGQYDWKSPDADRTNGYARHAEFYARMAQNHPSVVCYSMSHNATGTEESMNPEMIDGIHDVRNQWSANGAKLSLRAEAIVKRFDPDRVVYHHSSGNLGSMHTANFYANFAPIQEMSDWFQHWASAGVKPLFLCEYGVPISWDWMMYRGWYNGVREFGSARVPWELCLAEWNAQFFGDRAYRITDLEKQCLKWEAAQFRSGQLWHRWDYPRNAAGSAVFAERNEILALYLTDNLRAFRTLGVSAFCPWDHGIFWQLGEGTRRSRRDSPVDWDRLQRPGFSPDYIDDQMEWMNTSYQRTDWVPTAGAEALFRNNGPLLAYIGGKANAVTSKDHNFFAGETIEKQIVVINNSRMPVAVECAWSIDLPLPVSGRRKVVVETGQQACVPVTIPLPAGIKPGAYTLTMLARLPDAKTQQDTFSVHIFSRPQALGKLSRLALFDGPGETEKLLRNLGVNYERVDARADLSAFDYLVVGKGALDLNSPGPDLRRVRDGLRVLVFEQTSEVLEKRLGFRVAEYGLRNVFRRVPDHPALAGVPEQALRDWRGEATLVPPRLKYEIGQRHAPEVKWCDIPVTRLWRAGNRGSVASVLIEKPGRGDFLPVLDGGFSLQYSPLLEYREGRGMVLFSQLDLTGRTEPDPAAEILARNLLQYLAAWKPSYNRAVVYSGEAAGRSHLEVAGLSPRGWDGGDLSKNDLLVVGPRGGQGSVMSGEAVGGFLKAGGRIVVVGNGEEEANSVLPLKVGMKRAEHIAAWFEPAGGGTAWAGLSSADVQNRDPRTISLVDSGLSVLAGGVLARNEDDSVVCCQLAPWWFAANEQSNFRRTFRRTSFLLARILSNLGAASTTPVLDRFQSPAPRDEGAWLHGLYLDAPQEWDDPYRFFCW